LLAYFLIPETKGVSIEDMGLLFVPVVSIIAQKARRNWDVNSEDLTVEERRVMEKEKDLDAFVERF
jgi:hypothetical protein